MAPPSTPGHPVTSGMFDRITEVRIGSRSMFKTFMLHEGLLRHYSGYFDAALKGGFAEARSRLIELQEEDIETFERFVVWLYTGKVTQVQDVEPDYGPIISLWMLGDRRQIPLLCNLTVNILRDEIVRTWKVPVAYMRLVYNSSAPGSKLREFLVWVISNTSEPKILDDADAHEWPSEALFDLLQAVWHLREKRTARVSKDVLRGTDMCAFHQHGTNERCSETIIP